MWSSCGRKTGSRELHAVARGLVFPECAATASSNGRAKPDQRNKPGEVPPASSRVRTPSRRAGSASRVAGGESEQAMASRFFFRRMATTSHAFLVMLGGLASAQDVHPLEPESRREGIEGARNC